MLNEPKTLTVQVEEIGMFGERLETENLAFNPVRAGGKLRIDWSREVDIAPAARVGCARCDPPGRRLVGGPAFHGA